MCEIMCPADMGRRRTSFHNQYTCRFSITKMGFIFLALLHSKSLYILPKFSIKLTKYMYSWNLDKNEQGLDTMRIKASFV